MEAPPPRHLGSHLWNLAVLALGGGLLAWTLHRVGVAGLRHVFAEVGGWLPVMVALDLATVACNAAALHAFMRPEARMVGYGRVAAAQLAGVAINTLTPSGTVGEATKVTMLVGHLPRTRAVSSVVLQNLAGLYLSVAVLMIGLPLTAALSPLPTRVVAVAGAITVLALAAGAGVAWLVHRGVVGSAVGAARALRVIGPARAAAWKARLADVDRHLRALHVEWGPGTRVAVAFVVAGRVVGWASTITLMYAVGIPLRAGLVIGVVSVGVVIGWVAAFVPLGAGVTEGGNYALLSALGVGGGAGVELALASRVRGATLALCGLAVMAAMHTATRISLARRRARARAAGHPRA